MYEHYDVDDDEINRYLLYHCIHLETIDDTASVSILRLDLAPFSQLEIQTKSNNI